MLSAVKERQAESRVVFETVITAEVRMIRLGWGPAWGVLEQPCNNLNFELPTSGSLLLVNRSCFQVDEGASQEQSSLRELSVLSY